MKHHPDRYVDRVGEQEEAAQKFIIVAEAYDVLSDPVRRKEYDLLLEHGFFRYDPREYAAIMNKKAGEWASRAGFTFRRYSPGGESDDSWLLYIGVAFTLISISVPLIQYFRRRSNALAKKKEAQQELKKVMEGAKESAKRKEQERRTLQQQQLEAQRAAMAAAAQEREDEDQDDDHRPSLTPEQQREREERRQMKMHQKKTKAEFRAMVHRVVVQEVNANGETGQASVDSGRHDYLVPQVSDIDLLVSHLPFSELESLVHALKPLIAIESADTSSSASSSISSGLSSAANIESIRILSPAIRRVRQREEQRLDEIKRAHQKAEEAAAASAAAQSHSSSTSSSTSSSKLIPWTAAEMSALAKGTEKFPGGTAGRWDRIADLVNSASPSGVKRSVKEVLAKSRERDIHRLQQAPILSKSDVMLTGSGAVKEKVNKQKGSTDASTKSASDPATSPPVDVDEWNADQQASLERALRTVPKTAEDRWEQIAKLVPGKSKKQVMQRFKLIKAQILASKAATNSSS